MNAKNVKREAMTVADAWKEYASSNRILDDNSMEVGIAQHAFDAGFQAALSRAAEPVAWEFQHEETGLMTQVSNNGLDTIENFTANNPRWQYIGPLYRHPPEPARGAKRDQRMFIEGWRAAAEWANRWDLISDVDSPAWITRFDAAMAKDR